MRIRATEFSSPLASTANGAMAPPRRPAAHFLPIVHAIPAGYGWLARFLVGFALLALPSAFALKPDEKTANYIATHWDTEDGLPHNAIKQLFQTRDGYLWIGTQQGLARFDGLRFTNFSSHNTPAFKNNQITTLAETADGSLWIGTSANLIRYLDGQFTSYTQADGLKSETINTVCVVPDGTLWIGGRYGVTRWVAGKFVNDIDTSAYDTLGMRNITVDRHHNIWLAIGATALRYHNGGFTSYGRAEGLPGRQLQIVREDAEGRIVAVTQNGLFRLDGERFVPMDENAALSSPRISRTLVDRAGNFWVGSVNGLDRVHRGIVAPYTGQYGNRLGVVDALLEDREGCLWAGTSDGLYRMTDRRAHSLSQEEGVPGTLVLGLKHTRDGSLWISSWGAGVVRFRDGITTRYTPGSPLSHDSITYLHEAPDGAMWLGNRGSAIDRIEGGRITTYVYQPGVATSRPVTAILTAATGELLVGINRRGLLHLADGKLVPVPEAAALADDTVWSLAQTRDGRLLMGTTKGLYQRRADRTWELLTLPGLPPPVVVRTLLEDDDGTLWLATDGAGLVRWKNGQARSFGTREGVLDDILFSVVDDGLGSLWVTSARGISRIRKGDIAQLELGNVSRLNCINFGRVDGLLSASNSGSGGPAATRMPDGRVFSATDKGVAVIDPRLLTVNTQPPTVVIESVLADEEPQAVGREIIIAPGNGKLEIRYTALSLIAPHLLRFRYMLEGSDVRWIEAGHDRRAHYTHLAPGKYTFRVLACNNDGVWNQTGTTLALTLQPHFYQTLWFRLTGIVLLALVLAFLVWLRLRQLTRRQEALRRANAELDQRVQERTAELSRSHEELQQRELLFRLIFEHAPVGISWKRADLSANYHFNSTFRRILTLPADSLPDTSQLTALLHPEDAPRQAVLDRLVADGQSDSYTVEQRYLRPDGGVVWALLSVAVIRDAHHRIIQDIGILEDVTARKQAEEKLAETYKNLVEVSRTAGMAEVATSVLHNVGNVLNSVNVAAGVISTGLRHSKAESLAKLSALLQGHTTDLARFITEDPKGRRVPEYIESLARHSLEERDRLLGETASLQENIDHIKDIVSMQQAYATMVCVVEPLDPALLVEDALRMNTGALARHEVRVVRDFRPTPPVLAEKAKVLQILINVIRNAKYACDEGQGTDKHITITIEPGAAGRVRFIIRDNGVGIPPENITRIFAHGFTTRKDGHGFGLHSAANAAKEMKGSLTARSDGAGKGATFILDLPAAEPAAQAATAA